MRIARYFLFMLALLSSVSMWGQFNPNNPTEPGGGESEDHRYTLTLAVTPVEGGSFSANNGSYTTSTSITVTKGARVELRSSANKNFYFVAWEQEGEVINTSSSFTYQMPEKDVKLVAHFNYSPPNPGDPSEPQEKPKYAIIYLTASPTEGGYFYITSGNSYQVGSPVQLKSSANSNYTFKYWTENDTIISTTNTFVYKVKETDSYLTAHFDYTPGNPDEPPLPHLYHKLFLKSNPAGGGYFNESSGNSYQEGYSVKLKASSNQYYTFKNWTFEDTDSIVSNNSNFNYLMPDYDVTLTANFEYNFNYDPSNPDEPNPSTGEKANIYGMTENGVRGQTITYPVFLENTSELVGAAVDVHFPKGFAVNTDEIALSGRVSGHHLTLTDLGNNNFRILLMGEEPFAGNNGKIFELPVTIPDTATMGSNNLVALTHGVMHKADSTHTPITVRSGYIYVEKVMEDGLYAKFSYDKLQNRVKFTNLSSGKAVSFLWDFGDGTTSTEKNPLHVYSKSGYYQVKLEAKGEVDTDMAEMTVLINEESSWKVDGTLYLSNEETGVRYFSSADKLFSFLGNSTVSGNLRIAVKADQTFSYPLTSANMTTLRKVQSDLSSQSFIMSFLKNGEGRNPVLTFGGEGENPNQGIADFFVEWGRNLTCEGVDIQLWGVSFNPAQIKLIDNQIIHSGEKTKEVDFSSISPDLTFTWTLSSVPENVTGFKTSGTRSIPAMVIVNEGEGNCNLVYKVTGMYGNTTFCQFTNTITVTPTLVGLFSNMSPANNAILDATTVTLSWNRITNAVYDVYLWNAANQRNPSPVASDISELQYISKDFCQFGNSYKWQVVAHNEGMEMASDTMHFSINSLPNLHVYDLDCSEPTAGKKFTVQYTVRNDGIGSTGAQEWNDYIWLVTDIYEGTQPSGESQNNVQLLATVKNVKALASGESYNNKVDVTLGERLHGNCYLLVATDMYNVYNIGWNTVGGSIVNPYNPTQDGSGYKHLYASTSSNYNKVYEQDETTTYSDNFFYKKINIAVPLLPDLQVPKVQAEVVPLGHVTDDDIYAASEACIPTPLTAAGIAHNKTFYSGKKVKVTATVTNKGDAEIPYKSWNSALYVSSSPDRETGNLIPMGTSTIRAALKPGESTNVTFYANLPYTWYGETYFHVWTDIHDQVNELANTENNWGCSDSINVLLTPGADFKPMDLVVSSQATVGGTMNVSYKVENVGPGIPYVYTWVDKVYLSKSDKGLDSSAKQVDMLGHGGYFQGPTIANAPPNLIIPAEDFHFTGDDYNAGRQIKLSGLPSGKYYVYVKVDAENAVFEYEGEDNNVIMGGPIQLTQPDLAIELVSISENTLATGKEVAFTWKLKNVGDADIKDAKITDTFYATVNQIATEGMKFATMENNVWIAAGEEKTLRANIKIPSNSKLDGVLYIYMRTNENNSLAETNTSNNTSRVIMTTCKYLTEPVEEVPEARGTNLYVSNLDVKKEVCPGDTVTLTYTARNNGDTDLAEVEVGHELYITTEKTFKSGNAVKCDIIRTSGTVSGLLVGKARSIGLTFVVPNTYGGSKYLHLFVDKANTLGEKNTSDNTESTPISIRGNLPDLEVTAFTLPDTLMTSEDYTLAFTISNKGTWDAAKSTANVFLSTDNKYNNNDKLIGTVECPALQKGNSSQFTRTINIPDKMVGNWYVLICCDVRNSVAELDGDNNVTAIPITVLASPLPDLKVSQLSTDSLLTNGQPMHISIKVGNQGAYQTRIDKWADTYYLSPSTVLNTKDAIQLGSKTHVGRLAVGGEYESNVTFTIPTTVQGNYMLFVVTDGGDAIAEEEENNNSRSIPVFVNGSADRPAELMVTNVSAPASIKAGDNVTITYKVANNGEFAAAGNLHDVIYFSKDNQWDMDDPMVGVVSGNVSIEAGGELTRSATGRIINMPEGDYHIIVKTNSTHNIAETSLDNNVGVMNTTSSLSFNSITLGGTQSVNTSGYYKLNVPNGYEGKTVGFYLDHPANAQAGLYASYESVPSTAKFGFASSALAETQQEVLIPNVAAGNYYILAQNNAALVNSTGNVFSLDGGSSSSVNTPMTLNAKDIHFGATTLSVKEGGTGGWVSTDINGAMFDSIMDFRLKIDEWVIPAEVTNYNGFTRQRVTFNLNTAQTGTYDVVSELPDGTLATLPEGFKVVPGASVGLGLKIDAPSIVRQGSYAPISITYANGGNTDIELYDLLLVIDDGYLATSIEGLNSRQSVLHLPIDAENDSRGYKIIPPDTQKSINIFMYQIAAASHIAVYLVK